MKSYKYIILRFHTFLTIRCSCNSYTTLIIRFLQNPTIASLAEQIGSCPPIESEQEEMARLLQELEGISDEEAERLLTAEAQKDSDSPRR